MRVEKTWTELKNLASSKDLEHLLQYNESDAEYYIWFVEDSIQYFCIIDKVSPASSDQTDFETNYKPNANKVLTPKSKDNKTYVRAESRPLDTTTVFIGQADSDTNIGDGKELFWDFSNDDDIVTDGVPTGYKRKRMEFKFLDPVYVKEGCIYFFNKLKGSYIDFMIVCPAGQYYYDNDGNPQLATEDTIISWYVRHLFMQSDCPMGDELNTEACSSQIPPNYKFWIEITVPEDDNASNGYVEIKLYRKRTIVL